MDLIDREVVIAKAEEDCFGGWVELPIEVMRSRIYEFPTVDAVPMSVIEEIKADIIEMRKRDPLYYYVSTEDILDWVLNTIDRKVKEHTS